MVAGSQPSLYARDKYLFASGTLVIITFAASYCNIRLVLSATAYKLIASVRGSASEKLPGYCFPVLHASTNNGNAWEVCCTWLLVSVFALAGLSIFFPEII